VVSVEAFAAVLEIIRDLSASGVRYQNDWPSA
jgi:hypothetical protein